MARRQLSKQREEQKAEWKTVVLCMLNSLINFVVRLPETSLLVFNAFFYVYFIQLQNIDKSEINVASANTDVMNPLYACFYYNFCSVAVGNVASFFYVATLSLYFFVYYKFNTNFNECVNDYFAKKKSSSVTYTQ